MHTPSKINLHVKILSHSIMNTVVSLNCLFIAFSFNSWHKKIICTYHMLINTKEINSKMVRLIAVQHSTHVLSTPTC